MIDFYIVLIHCSRKCFTTITKIYHYVRLIATTGNSQVYREECMPSLPLQEVQRRRAPVLMEQTKASCRSL